jgi:hypothetical protein
VTLIATAYMHCNEFTHLSDGTSLPTGAGSHSHEQGGKSGDYHDQPEVVLHIVHPSLVQIIKGLFPVDYKFGGGRCPLSHPVRDEPKNASE